LVLRFEVFTVQAGSLGKKGILNRRGNRWPGKEIRKRLAKYRGFGRNDYFVKKL